MMMGIIPHLFILGVDKMEITFDMEGVNEALRKFDQLNLFTRKEIIRQTAKSTLQVEGDAKENAPVDVGNLRGNIYSRFEDGGLAGIVFTSPKYAPYVEFGRPAGRPPPSDALAGWARRHGLKGLEYVIARAIGDRGLPPQPFLTPAFEAEKDNYIQEVTKIIKEMEGV